MSDGFRQVPVLRRRLLTGGDAPGPASIPRGDELFPDLAFALPVPADDPGDSFQVGVGVID